MPGFLTVGVCILNVVRFLDCVKFLLQLQLSWVWMSSSGHMRYTSIWGDERTLNLKELASVNIKLYSEFNLATSGFAYLFWDSVGMIL